MISNITDSETRKKIKQLRNIQNGGRTGNGKFHRFRSDQKEKEIRLIINNGKSIHMYLQVFKQALIWSYMSWNPLIYNLYNMYNQMKENITISTKS